MALDDIEGSSGKRQGSTLESATKKLKIDVDTADADTDVEDGEDRENGEDPGGTENPEEPNLSWDLPRRGVNRSLFTEKQNLAEELKKFSGPEKVLLSEDEWLEMTELSDRLDRIQRLQDVVDRFDKYEASPEEGEENEDLCTGEEFTGEPTLNFVDFTEEDATREVEPGAPEYQPHTQDLLNLDQSDYMSDSDEEDTRGGAEPRRGEPSKLSSTGSLSVVTDGNSNKTKEPNLLHGEDVNRNPRPRTERLELPDPFKNDDVSMLALAHNVAYSRWHKVNRQDLNSPGSVFSVGSWNPSNRWKKSSSSVVSSLRAKVTKEGGEQGRRSMILAPLCVNLWAFLSADDGLTDVPHSWGDGWIELVEVYKLMLNNADYPPPLAFHRIMIQGLRDNPDPCVRMVVYSALRLTFKFLSPGPMDMFASSFYLEVMSTARPEHLKPGLENQNEPWAFLLDLVEAAVNHEEKERPVRRQDLEDGRPEGEPLVEVPGIQLLLQFWTDVLELDLRQWYCFYVGEERISFDGIRRPILARTIFLTGEVRWNLRCEALCRFYVSTLVRGAPQIVKSCLRRLLGLVAQLLNLREKMKEEGTVPEDELNIFKFQMSRYIANLLHGEDLDAKLLKRELFLLEPSWLSCSVSTLLLGRISGVHFKSLPGLRDIVTNFVDIPLREEEEETVDSQDELDSKENSQPAVGTSTPKSSSRTSLTSKTPPRTAAKGRIDLKKRNQYGEYQIHLACKKSDVTKLRRILHTPGVELNVTDHAGNTPLHEAVLAGSLDCVKLLLEFGLQPTIDKFFLVTPPKKAAAGTEQARKKKFADLLAVDEGQETPVHYAVLNGRTEILKLILEFTLEQENKPSSQHPKLADILMINGVWMESLVEEGEIKDLLRDYRQMLKPAPTQDPTLSLALATSPRFQVLLRNSLHRYMGGHGLLLVYRLWKISKLNEEFKPETILRKIQNGEDIPLHQDLERFAPVDYYDSRPFYHFDNPPRFDLYRSALVRVTDIKSTENLRFHKEKLKKLDPLNPIISSLSMLYY